MPNNISKLYGICSANIEDKKEDQELSPKL